MSCFPESKAKIAFYNMPMENMHLYECAKHIEDPKFHGIIFVRNHDQISELVEKSKEIYPALGGRLKMSNCARWLFPSKAQITFDYAEDRKRMYNWGGAVLPLIIFDDLTQFSRKQFWYICSRNRSYTKVAPYIRATFGKLNPDSWVKELVKLLDYDEYGTLKYFCTTNGNFILFNCEKSFKEHINIVHGKGTFDSKCLDNTFTCFGG